MTVGTLEDEENETLQQIDWQTDVSTLTSTTFASFQVRITRENLISTLGIEVFRLFILNKQISTLFSLPLPSAPTRHAW